MPAFHPAEIHVLFADAFNRGDVEAIAALYEADAVYVVNGQHLIGRDRIREAYGNLLPDRGRMTLETCAVVESPQGLALLHGRWTVEPPSGTPIMRGLSTEVVRKQPNGIWLFAIDSPYAP
jgi:uncharacterized protein (TIGR02246 family)